MQQLFNLSRVKNNSCPNHPWFPLLKNINADSFFLLLKICFHFWPERHWPEKYWPEFQAWTSDAWSDRGWVPFRRVAWTSKFQGPERHCPERHGFKLTNKQWITTKVRAGQSRNDEWGQEPQGLLRKAARNLEREDGNQRPPPCRMAQSAKRRKKEDFAHNAGNSSQQFTWLVNRGTPSCDRARCPIPDSSTAGRPARTG